MGIRASARNPRTRDADQGPVRRIDDEDADVMVFSVCFFQRFVQMRIGAFDWTRVHALCQ
jgi:hypothetical protein